MDSTGRFLMGILVAYVIYKLLDRLLKIIEFRIKQVECDKKITKILDRDDFLD